MRAYLRTEGDRKRLRMVAPGYDATDMGVPYDKVLFDSESHGMASFMESGEAVIPQGSNNFTALTEGLNIRTWSPALTFVPLCIFTFLPYSGFGFTTATEAVTGAGSTGTTLNMPQIRVSTSGIWVRGAFPKGTGVTFVIRWVALRVPAL